MTLCNQNEIIPVRITAPHPDALLHQMYRLGSAGLILVLVTGGCTDKDTTPSIETRMSTQDKGVKPPSPAIFGKQAPLDKSKQSPEPTPRTVPTKPSPQTDQALRDACFEGKMKAVRSALAKGARINATDEDKRTALMLAAYDGHTQIVDLLLRNGAKIDDQDGMGRTALMYAASGPYAKRCDCS